jgi:hypothetical protein
MFKQDMEKQGNGAAKETAGKATKGWKGPSLMAVPVDSKCLPRYKGFISSFTSPKTRAWCDSIWTVVKPSNAASPMLKKCVSGLSVIAQIPPSRTFFSELFFLNAWEYPKNHNRFQIGYFQCP